MIDVAAGKDTTPRTAISRRSRRGNVSAKLGRRLRRARREAGRSGGHSHPHLRDTATGGGSVMAPPVDIYHLGHQAASRSRPAGRPGAFRCHRNLTPACCTASGRYPRARAAPVQTPTGPFSRGDKNYRAQNTARPATDVPRPPGARFLADWAARGSPAGWNTRDAPAQAEIISGSGHGRKRLLCANAGWTVAEC